MGGKARVQVWKVSTAVLTWYPTNHYRRSQPRYIKIAGNAISCQVFLVNVSSVVLFECAHQHIPQATNFLGIFCTSETLTSSHHACAWDAQETASGAWHTFF
jgi:hypothetical protein